MSEVYAFTPGETPLLVSFPHDGTAIPPEVERRMTEAARERPDTDWHVSRLYDFVGELGASVIVPRMSRYVVDLNRDPTGEVLYPGADNTGIVPVTTFDRDPIYHAGSEPHVAEIDERLERWFKPYHAQLATEVDRLLSLHGVAVVLDVHSIRSVLPRFFDGVLPDLNLGTVSGASAAPALADAVWSNLARASGYSAVRDGRFKGGYITRRFGEPARRVHAVQLELAQKSYMDEAPPFAFDDAKASKLRPVLREFVATLIAWAQQSVA